MRERFTVDPKSFPGEMLKFSMKVEVLPVLACMGAVAAGPETGSRWNLHFTACDWLHWGILNPDDGTAMFPSLEALP